MNNHNNNINNNNINKHQKSMICIYTNKGKNEFAIRLKDDEHLRAMTKVCEFYIKVGVIDFVVEIVCGALTFVLLGVALRRKFERKYTR